MKNRTRSHKSNLEPGLEKTVRKKKTLNNKETEEEIKLEICLIVYRVNESLLEVLEKTSKLMKISDFACSVSYIY